MQGEDDAAKQDSPCPLRPEALARRVADLDRTR